MTRSRAPIESRNTLATEASAAESRYNYLRARRRAIENVLVRDGLMVIEGSV